VDYQEAENCVSQNQERANPCCVFGVLGNGQPTADEIHVWRYFVREGGRRYRFPSISRRSSTPVPKLVEIIV